MAPSSGLVDLECMTSLTTLLFMPLIAKGIAFSILTRSEPYVMNAGENLDMDCEFYTKYFNLFDNPVLWIKTQYREHSRINIMSNINSPFKDTGRFKVTFIPSPPRYRLVLGIEELSLEDSGNYSCEIRGPETTVLGVVTHTLFVRAAVTDIALTKENCTDRCDVETPSIVSFTDDKSTHLQCIASGGNPPPDVRVYLDDFDITYRFHSETYTRLLGSEGLRIMHSSVHARTRQLVLHAEDDGKVLRCSASVPGLPENVTSAKVLVRYAPVITCSRSEAYVNERHAHVTCEVKAQPHVNLFYWIIENGTIISLGTIKDEYWTLVVDRTDDIKEIKLYTRRATPERFRTYTLVAENVVGSTRQDVTLERKIPKDNSGEDIPNYIDRIRNATSPVHMDYFIIPVKDHAQRHLANCQLYVQILAFQMILSCLRYLQLHL